MPMPEITTPSTTKSPKSLVVIIAVVVIALIAIVLISYYMPTQTGQPTGNQPKTDQPTNTTTDQTGNQPQVPQAPAEIFSYVGEVVSIGNGELKVLAKPVVNYLTTDTTLTVQTDANTQVVKRTIPKVLPKEGGSNLFKTENVKLTDLAKGDQVTVVSATNIKDKTTFVASRIEVLQIK